MKANRLLALSNRIYSALLVLYPSDFRRDYSGHMAQVFRDVCRDSYHQGGAWALVNWWADALVDLLQTVIEEHRKVSFTMFKTRLIQWRGWLGILAGIFLAASAIGQLQTSTQLQNLSLGALLPGMVFITLALLSIFLRYNAHINLFGKLALLAALVGAAASSVGWLLVVTLGDNFWQLAVGGWLLYLMGHT